MSTTGPSRKVMLLGEIAVGKTSLVRRLVHNTFEHNYKATVGVDIYEYRVAPEGLGLAPSRQMSETGGASECSGVSETSGASQGGEASEGGERAEARAAPVPRSAPAPSESPASGGLRLIIWDTDGDFGEAIFSHVYCRGAAAALVIADLSRPETWPSLGTLAKGFASHFPGRPYELVMNKHDLAPQVAEEDLAEQGGVSGLGQSVLLTSAKTGDGVERAFVALARKIVRRGL